MDTQYLNYMQNPAMMEALVNSSVSVEDANLRSREYAKMFSRNDDMREMMGETNLLQKTFSGYAETPLLSTQYFNASVASYVSSFAGFMSIERDFEQPNGLFYWFDVLGVTDYRKVIPNLGPDAYQDIQSMGMNVVSPTVTAETAYSVLEGHKLIPGSVRVRIEKKDQAPFELVDDGNGGFLAPAGKLDADPTLQKINYINGKVEFTLAEALVPGDDRLTIFAKEDATGIPQNYYKKEDGTLGDTPANNGYRPFDKRFIAKMNQIGLSTVPDMLVAEYNIAALGAMKKATGSDMATFLFTKLRELYTKMINYRLVSTLQNGYVGNTMNDLDLSANTGLAQKFMDYRSRVDLFDAYLINVETVLASKAVKGVDVTAYVAGPNACNQFQKGGIIGKWERNTKMTYISDLLGWYDGIPVLRSTDIYENTDDGMATFYAIHKTHDGQMAPLARGIYMPLTDTPTIGNYNNPTQMAAGIYYQEGTKYLAPELVQKVEFKFGF